LIVLCLSAPMLRAADSRAADSPIDPRTPDTRAEAEKDPVLAAMLTDLPSRSSSSTALKRSRILRPRPTLDRAKGQTARTSALRA
jgi:hypothetical protein